MTEPSREKFDPLARVRDLADSSRPFSQRAAFHDQIRQLLTANSVAVSEASQIAKGSITSRGSSAEATLPYADPEDLQRLRSARARSGRVMDQIATLELGRNAEAHNATVESMRSTPKSQLDFVSDDESMSYVRSLVLDGVNIDDFLGSMPPGMSDKVKKVLLNISLKDAPLAAEIARLAREYIQAIAAGTNQKPIPPVISGKPDPQPFVTQLLTEMQSEAQEQKGFYRSLLRPESILGLMGLYLNQRELDKVRNDPASIESIIGKDTARLRVTLSNGLTKEMYGSAAELKVLLEAECPDKPAGKLHSAIRFATRRQPVTKDGSVIQAVLVKRDKEVLQTFRKAGGDMEFSCPPADPTGQAYTVKSVRGQDKFEIDPPVPPFANDLDHPLKYIGMNFTVVSPTVYTPLPTAPEAEADEPDIHEVFELLAALDPAKKIQHLYEALLNRPTRSKETWQAADEGFVQLGQAIEVFLRASSTVRLSKDLQRVANALLVSGKTHDILKDDFETIHNNRAAEEVLLEASIPKAVPSDKPPEAATNEDKELDKFWNATPLNATLVGLMTKFEKTVKHKPLRTVDVVIGLTFSTFRKWAKDNSALFTPAFQAKTPSEQDTMVTNAIKRKCWAVRNP